MQRNVSRIGKGYNHYSECHAERIEVTSLNSEDFSLRSKLQKDIELCVAVISSLVEKCAMTHTKKSNLELKTRKI